ncbi:MAG: polysaccharide biosynthesis/export family protein [Planctomycetota bacterium]
MIIQLLHTYRGPLVGLIAAVLILLTTGCAPTQRFTDYHAFIQTPTPVVNDVPYRVGPPDVLEFKSYRVREVEAYRETVSPDGKVNLPLLGTITVAGKTTEEIRLEVNRLAQFYYEDADVSVRVTRYASKKIFVFGQVGAPGAYYYNGSNTVLNTLAQAQPTELADPTHIQILRPNPDGELRARMTINLDEMITRGDTTLNAVLQEGDIIYVPANGMAKVALGLQQVLLPLRAVTGVVNNTDSVGTTTTGQSPYGDSGE